MKNPVILATDDDPQVLRAIERDLRKKYRKQYRVLSVDSPGEAISVVEQLRQKGENLAMMVSDQRMPGMLGVEFLEKAKQWYPEAKKVLLTAYSDTDAAIKAINDVQLDYYLMKPWDPPEEKMYPVLDGLLEDWKMNFRPEFEGIKVVGYQFSPKSHNIKDFLAGNLIPYQWLDVEVHEKAKQLLEVNGLEENQGPVVFLEDGTHLIDPALAELGEKVGLKSKAASTMYDVVVIGAGPAGLAASVYGASEGLKTLLIERKAPGGQAGTSSRIENYLGFPSGLSGAELTQRAVAQATRLGAEFLTPKEVKTLKLVDGYKQLEMVDGSSINTRAVVITTGV
ncbi:MAG TPA: fused response regulator/thioredoxin-disulfide reductase, partial [Cytophagales bacterium]|nr:fused response regulator/thioredoxin-disulfide reductase [Cytophagales bacterium]